MRRVGIFLVLTLLLAPCLYASNRYDPRLRFRTLTTPRFDIHFHQGEDALARRLAAIAEGVATELAPRLGHPRARVHVILVAQTDLANGWATPLPYNLIEIVAASPRGDSLIGNTNNWLRLVFTHEYTHVLHLERSRGLLGSIGRVFGRNPFFYPNLLLPTWQIEGLATYHESATTKDGRIPAGDFRTIVHRAASAGRFAGLDRASSQLVGWPNGHAPYLYGGLFHQYLAETYGEQSLTRLADAQAGRLPFFGSPSFKKVFGKSLGRLWDDFERETVKRAPAQTDAPRRLTHHGYFVEDPWFAGETLVYSVADPHGFPMLMQWAESGSRPLATRSGGEQISGRALRTLVFDQVEYVRSVALQLDLYLRDGTDGDVRRLTREARASDPDVSAGGQIACILQTIEGRAVATMAMPAAGALGVPAAITREPGVDYSSPRWSPDGRTIAVERRPGDGPSEIVLLDPATGAIQKVVTSSPRGRNTAPVWAPDGRTLYFASDREGNDFQIYSSEVSTGALRRLEGTGLTARSPTVSADGATLVFVGYTPEGYDLFSVPVAGARWQEVANSTPRADARPPDPAPTSSVPTSEAYSPLSTLWPRFWSPIIEEDGDDIAIGAETAGADALGRHSYFASAAWSTRGRPDWSAAYAYDRWRPTLFVDASDDQDPFREGDIRVREVNAGALLSFRRVRRVQVLAAAFHAAHEQIQCEACTPPETGDADRRALRAGYVFGTSRGFGYSISNEEGFSASLSGEWTASWLGADGTSTALVADLRGYLRAGPRHAVFAGRLAAAQGRGDDAVRRVFAAGGNGAGVPLLDFASDAVGLMRGFESGDLFGRTAVVANLDYRLPFAWIERGPGTLPFFLRSLHGAVFADVGSAWEEKRSKDDWRASLGAELSADVVLGYSLPLTFSGGVAWRYDPTHRSEGATLFARVGRAY